MLTNLAWTTEMSTLMDGINLVVDSMHSSREDDKDELI